MTSPLRYNAEAAWQLLDPFLLEDLGPRLLSARDEMFQDVALYDSGNDIPADKQPLDAKFIDLPFRLLDEFAENAAGSLLGRIQEAATYLREQTDRVVLLGIGGSYMGARALFEGLCNPYHNELSRASRGGVPRLYFEGNNVDNDAVADLLKLLRANCRNPQELADRWSTIVISKSGGTLETAVAFRVFRQALEEFYGADSEESRNCVVPVTGETGKLRDLSNSHGYHRVFPIPDCVGGRVSFFTAVRLLPAAFLVLDKQGILEGAASITETCRNNSLGDNPVLDYTAICHLFEREQNVNIRVLSTWGKKLEAIGLWYDQLLAESLGKHERGATPLTVVNTRDLHSRGQQHQEGRRDKLITNVIVEADECQPVTVPKMKDDHDQLNRFAGKSYGEILQAAVQGTNQAYADEQRPTADIILPRLDEFTLGQLLQMLMLATVVEGRLIGINPYGQPGVEAYKKNTMANLQL